MRRRRRSLSVVIETIGSSSPFLWSFRLLLGLVVADALERRGGQLYVQLVGVVGISVLERQAREEDQARPRLDALEELGQALQILLADLDVHVVLDVAAAGGNGGALARFGDLNVLAARGGLQIGGELRRIVADAGLLDGVAGLGLQVFVAVLGDGAERVPDSRILVLKIADPVHGVARGRNETHRQDRDPQHRDPAPLAGGESLPPRGETGGRDAENPHRGFANLVEGAHIHLGFTGSRTFGGDVEGELLAAPRDLGDGAFGYVFE